jgi:hypothetical protein
MIKATNKKNYNQTNRLNYQKQFHKTNGIKSVLHNLFIYLLFNY